MNIDAAEINVVLTTTTTTSSSPPSLPLGGIPHFDFSDEDDNIIKVEGYDGTSTSNNDYNAVGLQQQQQAEMMDVHQDQGGGGGDTAMMLTVPPLSSSSLPEIPSQQEMPPQSARKRGFAKVGRIYHQNSFLILVTCAILLAYAYPPLGAIYVAPQITATWIAVIFIFLLAGMGIHTEEFSKALQRVYFNSFVQVFNFMIVSAVVYGFTRFMLHVNALPESLADGMTIASTLSVSVNMGIVLTKLVGGDEAAAIFDAAFGNFLGVFLSPALILMYLGLNADVDLGQVTLKLFLRVVLPLLIGQLLRNYFPPAKAFVKKYNKFFRQGQEFSLVFIIYTIFCKTFLKGNEATTSDVFIMIGCVLLVLLFLMALAWVSMLLLFPKEPKLQAVGLYACTHKTVAVGIPLITSIFADSPMLGLYVLPLLIWYTTQLVLGTALVPHMKKYVKRKQEILLQQQELDRTNNNNCDACRGGDIEQQHDENESRGIVPNGTAV